MGKMNVCQDIHIVPIRATTSASAAFTPPFVDMKEYEKVEFIIHFGQLSGGNAVLTVNQSAAAAGSDVTAIAARYRLTTTAGTDTMGATTALESTGLTLTDGTYDLMTLIVDVDSQDMTTEDKPFVGLVFAGSVTTITTIIALCWPKYPKETNAGALT